MRVLIASPLAHVVEHRLAERFDVNVARDRDELVAFVEGKEPDPDVCLLDLLWISASHEWTFDGLDAVRILDRLEPAPRVLVALFGHSAEADYLDEIAQHPRYWGAILKADALNLVPALAAVANHQRFATALPALQPRSHRVALATAFASNERLARVAGAIASAHYETWEAVGDATGYTRSAVEKSGERFAPLLIERGDIPAGGRVTATVLSRWVGEHARYIVSWCRRNGMEQFERRT
jgi:chemotaxis response regulator CheB